MRLEFPILSLNPGLRPRCVGARCRASPSGRREGDGQPRRPVGHDRPGPRGSADRAAVDGGQRRVGPAKRAISRQLSAAYPVRSVSLRAPAPPDVRAHPRPLAPHVAAWAALCGGVAVVAAAAGPARRGPAVGLAGARSTAADRLAWFSQRQRPLYSCFNQPLRARLSRQQRRNRGIQTR